MASLPYIQLYPADYLADTQHLETCEHGIYLLLIFNYWLRDKPFIDNDSEFCKLLNITIDVWQKHKETIAEFFEIKNGFWYHWRIESDLEKARKKVFKKNNSVNNRLPVIEWKNLREYVFGRDNYTCQYCGQYGKKLECDHIVPISRGGSNDLDNLITTCKNCNRQKRDKLLLEFVLWKLKKDINYAMV